MLKKVLANNENSFIFDTSQMSTSWLFLDIIFYQFMKRATDMSKSMIYKIFDMLDFDGSGQIDFNEFYVIICILVAVKVRLCYTQL